MTATPCVSGRARSPARSHFVSWQAQVDPRSAQRCGHWRSPSPAPPSTKTAALRVCERAVGRARRVAVVDLILVARGRGLLHGAGPGALFALALARTRDAFLARLLSPLGFPLLLLRSTARDRCGLLIGRSAAQRRRRTHARGFCGRWGLAHSRSGLQGC